MPCTLFIEFIDRQFGGSRAAAALALGLSKSTVSRICSGERGITPAVAERIEQLSDGAFMRGQFIWPSVTQKAS